MGDGCIYACIARQKSSGPSGSPCCAPSAESITVSLYNKLYIINGITGEIKWSAVAGDGPYAITVLPKE